MHVCARGVLFNHHRQPPASCRLRLWTNPDQPYTNSSHAECTAMQCKHLHGFNTHSQLPNLLLIQSRATRASLQLVYRPEPVGRFKTPNLTSTLPFARIWGIPVASTYGQKNSDFMKGSHALQICVYECLMLASDCHVVWFGEQHYLHWPQGGGTPGRLLHTDIHTWHRLLVLVAFVGNYGF